jgi:hypothetical protein
MEEEMRTRLTPVLFPKRRGVKSALEAAFGNGKHTRPSAFNVDGLDDYEREVAQKMVNEVRVSFVCPAVDDGMS